MKPFRPRSPRTAAPLHQPAAAAPEKVFEHPLPDANGTLIALVGFALTTLLLRGEAPSTLARIASIGTLISIGLSIACDMKIGGLRNLIRADLMAILAFYFLTLFEFLFPQPDFDTLIGARSAHFAILCVMLAFAGLYVGRHLFHPTTQPFAGTLTREIPARWIIVIFWACMLIGYAHMLIAVNFDVIEVVRQWLEPRFSQPWQRGKFGDWKALLVELGLFLYLIPPLGGIMIARRHRYSSFTLASAGAGLALTFFFAISSGTRNIFASYLVTFLIGYAFALPFAQKKELVWLCGGSAVLMVVISYFMLEFRDNGLRAYLAGEVAPPASVERTFFVDYNLYTISRVVEVFPEKHNYIGWETPYNALVRPIPRAIWKGKPEGLSVSLEEVLGVEGMTVGASFAGEAYISGGLLVVFITALGFGALTGWWSHLASPRNSELGILIYASGFFATVISMRSLFVFTTALLPTVAALVIGTYVVRVLNAQARRLLAAADIRRRATHGRPVPPPRRPAR
jgi:hypothetical protein